MVQAAALVLWIDLRLAPDGPSVAIDTLFATASPA
jgi:hypothetical protein